MEETDIVIPRDVRVDQIGFVAELEKQHANDLKSKVKVRMLNDEADRVRGDFFEGLLVKSDKRSLDPKKLFKLVKSGDISEAKFLEAVTVNLTAAAKLISGDKLDKLCDVEPGSPSLRVSKIKGVELSLVQALGQLAIAK